LKVLLSPFFWNEKESKLLWSNVGIFKSFNYLILLALNPLNGIKKLCSLKKIRAIVLIERTGGPMLWTLWLDVYSKDFCSKNLVGQIGIFFDWQCL
jgi:hypothetical protein